MDLFNCCTSSTRC
ncbi:hypothetical protein CesoFtcFv8_004047 [Champsocephalus esox]|uniref:Uncharacterized protein n=1 Tax=Champsocephalus esox TaxID=159716 RepID=A0AAN8CUE6_9TELE|nr:hypothetical protein CesoFtcFv8_004047 [Champsocephalus esox]